MKLLVASVVLVFSAVASGAELPAPCADALRRALASCAAWTMERRLPGSVRTLVSTGTVECTAGEGIVWKTLHPFPFSVSMTPDSMIFTDGDTKRVKPLSDLPHYADIKRRTDAFARGDADAFDGIFELEVKRSLGGAWHLELKPEVRAMRRLFSSIVLTGDETLTTAVFTTEDGGFSTIRFKESPRGR